jgi:hypothetical protein
MGEGPEEDSDYIESSPTAESDGAQEEQEFTYPDICEEDQLEFGTSKPSRIRFKVQRIVRK